MGKIKSILENFKNRIVAITHKDIPKYDWQEAGYSNAIAKAEEAIKNTRLTEEEINKLLVKEISTTYEGEIDIGSDMTKLAHAIYSAQTKKEEG